jgi:hypothetical protein
LYFENKKCLETILKKFIENINRELIAKVSIRRLLQKFVMLGVKKDEYFNM